MAEERLQKRLAAIMSADVVGYSRLMGTDEAGTQSRLNTLRRELIDPAIAAHSGRIVKLMGDGALSVTSSSKGDWPGLDISSQSPLSGKRRDRPARFRDRKAVKWCMFGLFLYLLSEGWAHAAPVNGMPEGYWVFVAARCHQIECLRERPSIDRFESQSAFQGNDPASVFKCLYFFTWQKRDFGECATCWFVRRNISGAAGKFTYENLSGIVGPYAQLRPQVEIVSQRLPCVGDIQFYSNVTVVFEFDRGFRSIRNNEIGAVLSNIQFSLSCHFSQLPFYRRVAFIEEIRTNPGCNEQQGSEQSQQARIDSEPPRPSSYNSFIYVVMIWISGTANAMIGVFLVTFCERRRLVAISIGIPLIALGGVMGWTGAAMLMGPKTPISSSAHLTTADDGAENIGIRPIVVPELKLGNIQRHVLFADTMECADHAAFEDRPETLNRICVDCANDVLALWWSTLPRGYSVFSLS
jgi:hypothetical protein